MVVEVRTLLLVVIPHYVRRVRRHPPHLLAVWRWRLQWRLQWRLGQEGHVGAGGDGAATKACAWQAVD